MRNLYPDLGGANPLVRSRRIDADDMQRFQQFGVGLFVNVDKNQHTRINLKPSVRALLDVFVRRIAARTAVLQDHDVASLMDWPHLRAGLRSQEKVTSLQGKQDLRVKIPSFWITMKQLVMTEMSKTGAGNNVRSSNSSTAYAGATQHKPTPLYYSGLHRTTLDQGGDCHRQPLVKITKAQLGTVLASDVCFVASGNDTHRLVRCTSKGMVNETVLELQTTSQRGIVDRNVFLEAKKLFKACGRDDTRKGRNNTSKIFAWNAASRSFEAHAVRDETSLSRRVRISPLWNMLGRLRGTVVHKTFDPLYAWGQTDTRRHDNPRWASNAEQADSADAEWQKNWVYTNTDAQCSNTSFGSISRENWYNNPNKADSCLRISREFQVSQGTCMQQLANTFDICQIDQLKDFCYAVQSIRTEVRQINAVANQYTNVHKNLYMPSRYMKQDGMFGWSAIVETYNTIDPRLLQDTNVCPGIAVLLANAAESYSENKECPATWVFQMSNFLESIRNIVNEVVNIIVLVQQILVDMGVFLLSALAGDKGMQSEKIQTILNGLKQLLLKMLDYFREMLGIMWQIITMDDGIFKSLEDLMKKLCNFAKNFCVTVLRVIREIVKAFQFMSGSAKGVWSAFLCIYSVSRAHFRMIFYVEYVFVGPARVPQRLLCFDTSVFHRCRHQARAGRGQRAGVELQFHGRQNEWTSHSKPTSARQHMFCGAEWFFDARRRIGRPCRRVFVRAHIILYARAAEHGASNLVHELQARKKWRHSTARFCLRVGHKTVRVRTAQHARHTMCHLRGLRSCRLDVQRAGVVLFELIFYSAVCRQHRTVVLPEDLDARRDGNLHFVCE